MIYVGLDPGVSGGIVALDADREVVFSCKLEAISLADLLAFLQDVAGYERPMAVLERVHSMPGQGHSGAFTFGRGFGHLEAMLTAAGIPFDYVVPRRWQAAIGVIYPKAAKDTVRKNISKARAQQLFPEYALTITHALADAMLIAEYCRRLHTGAIDGKEEGRRAQVPTQARRKAEGKETNPAPGGKRPPQRADPQAAGETAEPTAPRHGRRAHPRTR